MLVPIPMLVSVSMLAPASMLAQASMLTPFPTPASALGPRVGDSPEMEPVPIPIPVTVPIPVPIPEGRIMKTTGRTAMPRRRTQHGPPRPVEGNCFHQAQPPCSCGCRWQVGVEDEFHFPSRGRRRQVGDGGEGGGSVIHTQSFHAAGVAAASVRPGPERKPPWPEQVQFSNPRGPGDISRIGAGCDGTANLHDRGKLISAIHRRARHATEAPGRPVCVEGGKEMCPPSRSDPSPGPWKAHGRRRWISIPSTRRALLSLSPTNNVNYTRNPYAVRFDRQFCGKGGLHFVFPPVVAGR